MALPIALDKLREHLQKQQAQIIDTDLTEEELQAYASRLNKSLLTLQNSINKLEAELKKVILRAWLSFFLLLIRSM